ncbi:MAG: hypothetical protein AAB579_03740 [Patescibacteria group bacterium]
MGVYKGKNAFVALSSTIECAVVAGNINTTVSSVFPAQWMVVKEGMKFIT